MIEQLFNSLDETVKQSTLNDFRNFMSIHEGVTKWSIYSDYCIDDSSKLYNSATFTLIPYINAFDEVRATLKELAPKDLKKTKEVNQLFCEFIKSGYMFNLSILFKSGKEHVFHGIQKEAYFNSFDSLNDNLSEWIKNTPSMKDYYSKIIKKNNFMKQELARKTFNFKLLNNILLVQLITVYLYYLICSESKVKPEIIGWLSDRDNMTTYNNGIIYDLFHINFHGICNKYALDDSKIKLIFAQSDIKNSFVWFDEFLRIPDLLSGALAGRRDAVDEKDKYDTIFKKAILDNNFLSVIKIYNDEGIRGTCRLNFKLKEEA